MKVTNELINHFQQVIDKLTPIMESYTKDDINSLINDINQLFEEKLQLEKAKSDNKISKDEVEIAEGTHLIKQSYLGVVTTAALNYLRNELEKVTTGNAMLRAI